MKKLIYLLFVYMYDAYAQLRQHQDDSFGGYSGSGTGGAIIVSVIVILVLIFGGSSGRWGVFCIFSLFALPSGLAFLGNTLLPDPKIGGELSLAGLVGIFLGLYLWPKLLKVIENMNSSEK